MKNQVVMLNKLTIDGAPSLIFNFIRAEAYTDQDDMFPKTWLRGKSKFNISMMQWPVSEDMMRLFYRMIGTYQRHFEAPAIEVPKRPSIILPGQ